MMKIAILGTGIVGRTIAGKLKDVGHQVVIGTRDVESKLANEQPQRDGYGSFKDWIAGREIEVKTFAGAAADSEILFNCVSGRATIAALQTVAKESLAGKVLLDLANPLDFSQGMPPSLNPVNTDSLGEQIQQAFPETRVVKSLNSMSAHIMVDPTQLEGDHNVFVCGNDSDAKKIVCGLLESFGWNPDQIIDLGDISNARGTEMLLPLWLRLWNALGTADFNFHIQQK